MKQFQMIKSDDALQINVRGDVRKPEPSTLVVKFPGGHVEIARCSDGTYWAHVEAVDARNVVGSRIDYEFGAPQSVTDIPNGSQAKKLSLRISNTVPHFDADA